MFKFGVLLLKKKGGCVIFLVLMKWWLFVKLVYFVSVIL